MRFLPRCAFSPVVPYTTIQKFGVGKIMFLKEVTQKSKIQQQP